MVQTTKPLSDTALARALNRQAHRGGKLTEFGYWYSADERPDCLTYYLGDRDWTAAKVREARAMKAHASAMGRKGGQVTGGTKASTARANGKLGGRPKG